VWIAVSLVTERGQDAESTESNWLPMHAASVRRNRLLISNEWDGSTGDLAPRSLSVNVLENQRNTYASSTSLDTVQSLQVA